MCEYSFEMNNNNHPKINKHVLNINLYINTKCTLLYEIYKKYVTTITILLL